MQVTGALADALNWAGISEDEFNSKLAAAGSESERNQLIMETLAGTYDEASDAFYRNNEALVASREAQVQMDEVLSNLGQTVASVKNQLMAEFIPAIAQVATAFNGMLSGAEGADEAFATAVQGLVQKAVEQLPAFLNMGIQILSSLASGIVQSIPTLVSAVPQIIAEIGAALAELLPQVLDMGVQLLDQLATGVETELPNMVARLPQVIEAILNFITENLPSILEKGVELLSQFAFGIIDSIPILVASLPQIIHALTEFFVENFPKIIAAGGQLLGQLLVGIIGSIPEIAVHIPSVITALVEAIEAGWEQLKQAGAYLLEGLWAGIGDKIEWLKDKVSGVVDTIKSWFTGSDGFDEHSPSKWAKQVFRYVMEGGALGLDDGLGGVMSSVKAAGNTIKNGLDFGTASVDFASSGLGVSSAGIINSMGQSSGEWADGLTVNLTLPDGTPFATWQLPYLIRVASAAGTPIAGTQKA